eukprot:CAMPEP_0117740492 /NCGR_PEP_ID=MMETSP0947-20121206/4375_1 /TAXON_ID=44440 /ORGANISM="Chattonella subsalsa, Strain CCMP2191" /LENGTH=498 /DNA_ID=CAMNT_0005556619 /DNA_START=166 /DNA_END=1662 /DNA_ORIENTATION=-
MSNGVRKSFAFNQRIIEDRYDASAHAWKSGNLTSFKETPLSSYWDKLPEVADTGVVDVSTFTGLVGVCKMLLEITHLVPVCGRENLGNPFWQQVVLLDWIWRSGRFGQVPYGEELDEGSWWACLARSMVLSQLLAVQSIGLLGSMEVEDLILVGCTEEELEMLKPAIEYWTDFFYYEGTDLIPCLYQNTTYAPDFAREAYFTEFWVAQSSSLEFGFQIYFDRFSIMPPKEQFFALGWLRATNLIAEATTRQGLDWFMKYGTKYLPDKAIAKMESEDSQCPQISAMKSKTQQVVRRLRLLASLPGAIFLVLKQAWRRTFCLDFMRAKARQEKAINCLLHGNLFQAFLCVLKILFLALLPNIKYHALTQLPLGSRDEEFVFKSFVNLNEFQSTGDIEASLRDVLGDQEFDELRKEIQANIDAMDKESKGNGERGEIAKENSRNTADKEAKSIINNGTSNTNKMKLTGGVKNTSSETTLDQSTNSSNADNQSDGLDNIEFC